MPRLPYLQGAPTPCCGPEAACSFTDLKLFVPTGHLLSSPSLLISIPLTFTWSSCPG